MRGRTLRPLDLGYFHVSGEVARRFEQRDQFVDRQSLDASGRFAADFQ
jgi:hypothetical protein